MMPENDIQKLEKALNNFICKEEKECKWDSKSLEQEIKITFGNYYYNIPLTKLAYNLNEVVSYRIVKLEDNMKFNCKGNVYLGMAAFPKELYMNVKGEFFANLTLNPDDNSKFKLILILAIIILGIIILIIILFIIFNRKEKKGETLVNE